MPLLDLQRRLPARIADRITVDEHGCWIVSGYGSCGYAQKFYDGRTQGVHRVVYELLVGPIPEGLQIDHLCRVRRCANPEHLEPVTVRENVLRGVGITALHARKTHCSNGHEFNEENSYFNGRQRVCRPCQRFWWRRWNDERKAA